MIKIQRPDCQDVEEMTTREWLVTNGIGGYASGTVSGILTRRYHGLLLAALKPPLERTLLLTKLDEMVTYQDQAVPLYRNQWQSSVVEPQGSLPLKSFHLEGTIPVWTFQVGDAVFIKRIWMAQGENTTYVQYQYAEGFGPLNIQARILVNYRDSHSHTEAATLKLHAEMNSDGLSISGASGLPDYYLFCPEAEIFLNQEAVTGFYLAIEDDRGQIPHDDHIQVGEFTLELNPGQTVSVVASTSPEPLLDGDSALARRQAFEERLVAEALAEEIPDWIKQLHLAADQFIVRRPITGGRLGDQPGDREGVSVIAGYPWFGDWGRDTMISLTGLTLVTGRYELAEKILRTFADYVDQGMLPNRFPDGDSPPEYNTIDATLWYFEAVRQYLEFVDDPALLEDLYPVLESIIQAHIKGTRYRIHMDPIDGLLYGGQADVQLTWMDVKIGDWVVTPRTGKAVEINALWYNALKTMADFARDLEKDAPSYASLAYQVKQNFQRFWNTGLGCCYDVIDGPQGDDASIRPNQLFAVSLSPDLLEQEQQKAVVNCCQKHLLTPYGLRSLSPEDTSYQGQFRGDMTARDSAYHQGTVWGWLIGPFVSAHYRVYRDRQKARSFLEGFRLNLQEFGLGTINEIFEGDPPHAPRGCIAQAWSVAEVLRVWYQLQG